MNENEIEQTKAYIYGGIFALSNNLQLLGDKFDTNISTKQWFLIAVINTFQDEAPTISMTAERLGSSRQNVKKMASILEKSGFLKIIKDKSDARIQRLEVTKYCMEYFAERREREDIYMKRLFEGFDEVMLSDLFRGMSQLEKNIKQMGKEYDERE